MRASLAAAGTVAVLACSSEPSGDPLRLEVPVGMNHRAALVAFERGSQLDLHASPIEDGKIAPILGTLEPTPRVTVLLYEETLADLSISRGPVSAVEGGRALPAADVTLETHPINGQMVSWSEVQETSAALDAFRIADVTSPCPELVPATVSLGPSPAQFAFPIDTRAVLVEAGDATLYRFGRDRSKVVLASAPAAPQLFAAMAEPDGTLHFGAAGGSIWRGVLDESLTSIALTKTSTLPTVQDVLYLGGDPDDDLFVQTRDNAVFHFDGAAWKEIARIDGRGRAIGIARIAPGIALSAWADCLCVIRHSGMRVEEIAIPANSIGSNGVSTLLHDPNYGTVAGTFIGEILEARTTPDTWTKLEGTYSTIQVTSIARYGDAFVYADKRGAAVVRTHERYCDPLPPESPIDLAGHLAVLGDEVVVASNVLTWWSPVR